MVGVDQHDCHCSNLMPSIRSKKWTWVILLGIIQASITNATVLKNFVCDETSKVGTKDVALDITRNYLVKAPAQGPKAHKSVVAEKKLHELIEILKKNTENMHGL